MDKIEYKRLEYKHEGRTIYEWYQSLEEVHVFIAPPPGVTAKMIDCKIMATQLTLGIKGNPPFIDEPFSATINSSESMWTLEDGKASTMAAALRQTHASTHTHTHTQPTFSFGFRAMLMAL